MLNNNIIGIPGKVRVRETENKWAIYVKQNGLTTNPWKCAKVVNTEEEAREFVKNY